MIRKYELRDEKKSDEDKKLKEDTLTTKCTR